MARSPTSWRPGQSGNPTGRRRGTVLAQTKVRKMIEEAAPEIIERMIRTAKMGNLITGRFLLERIITAAKSAPIASPVALEGTPTEQAETVVAMLAAGKITTEDGDALLSAIGKTQAIQNSEEMRRRLADIEAKLAALTGPAPLPALPKPEQRAIGARSIPQPLRHGDRK